MFAFVKVDFLISEVSIVHSIASSWLRISDANLFVSISTTSSIAPSHSTCLFRTSCCSYRQQYLDLSFYCFQSWTDSPCLITKSNLKTKKQEEETKNVTVKATKENSWSRLKLIFFLVKLLRQIKTFVSHLAKLFTQMSLYNLYRDLSMFSL